MCRPSHPITLVEPQSIEGLVTEHQIAGSAAVQEVNSHHSVKLYNTNRQSLALFSEVWDWVVLFTLE